MDFNGRRLLVANKQSNEQKQKKTILELDTASSKMQSLQITVAQY